MVLLMLIYFIFGLSIGMLIGGLIGTLIVKYIAPLLDIKLEEYTYKKTVTCTEYQLTSQSMIDEYSAYYGKEDEEGGFVQAIGFQAPDTDEYYDDEFDD